MNFLHALNYCVSVLRKYGFEDAALAMEIETSLYQQGRVSAQEARTQANQFLSLLAK